MVLSFVTTRPSSLFAHPFDRLMAADPLLLRLPLLDSTSSPTDTEADTEADAAVASACTPNRHVSATRTVRSSYSSYTRDDATIVNVDLPGVPKHNITIDLHGRKLTITGRRATIPVPHSSSEQEKSTQPPAEPATVVVDDTKENGHDTEQQPMQVDRSNDQQATAASTANSTADATADANQDADVVYHTVLSLRSSIDVDAIEVLQMQHGVLTLRLPHRRHPEPRRLTVQ